MSETTVKPDDTERKANVAKLEAKLREDEQKQHLQQQNMWFYFLMSGRKPAKSASKETKELRKAIEGEIKKDEELQKHDVKETKFEPLYRDRLVRSKAKLDELKSYLPATAALVKKFEDAHAAAAVFEKKGMQWKEAFDALHVVSISGADDEAEKLWAAAEKNARKAAPAFFEKAVALETLLKQAASLLTVEVYDDFQARIGNAGGALCTGSVPDAAAVTKATENLVTIEGQLKQHGTAASRARNKAAGLRSTTETFLTQCTTAVQDFGGFTDRDLAVYHQQFRSADANIGLHSFTYAADLLEGLRLQIEAKKDEITGPALKAQAAWNNDKRDMRQLLEDAEALRDNKVLPESIQQAASEACRRVSILAGQVPGKDPTFVEAVEELAEIKADVATMKATAATLPEFLQAVQDADKKVQDLVAKAARSIENIPVALKAANGGKELNAAAIVAPFNDKLSGIVATWDKLRGAAVSVKELSEPQVSADLAKLLDDAGKVATTNATATAQGIVLAPARETYAAARTTAANAAAAVMAVNPVDGMSLMDTIEGFDAAADAATTPDAILEAAAALNTLASEQSVRATNSDTAIRKMQDALRIVLAKVPPLIETLRAAVNAKKDAATQKPFTALLEAVQTEYETLVALTSSKQRAMLHQGIDEASALISEVEKATLAVRGDSPKGAQTFKAAQTIINGYAKRLAANDVKTYALATATQLAERGTELSDTLGEILVTKLFAELERLGKAVEAVELKAQRGKEQAARLEELIGVQKARLDKPPFKTDSPDYAASVKARLAAILDDARFEDGLESAKVAFVRLVQEIDGAESSPLNLLGQRADLVARQEDAVQVARKAELDKAKWEGDLKVIQKQISAAKGGEVDSRELSGLQTMFNECKTAIERSHQYGDGRDQLRAITQRLSLLEANPYGMVISSRNRLPQVTARVKAAITSLNRALTDVSGVIDLLPEADLAADDKKAISAQFAALRGMFNPAAFDKSVPTVAEAEIDRNKRAAAREAALRDVRRMMGYVDDDYRMQALFETPFDPKMRSVLSGLKLGLLDLENNLLVSLPS